MILARNDLHEFAYAVMHALRDDHVAEEVGEDAAEDIADKVTDAIDWLDDHEDDDECAYLVWRVSVGYRRPSTAGSACTGMIVMPHDAGAVLLLRSFNFRRRHGRGGA